MADEIVNNDETNDDDSSGDTKKEKASSSFRPTQRSGPRRTGSQGRYNPKMGFRSRRKVCAFCADKIKVINWKDFDTLRRFIGDDGSIRARRKTGTCARHQRRLAVAIKQARHMAVLPFTGEHVRLAGKS